MSDVIKSYFAAFNRGDVDGMLDCLDGDVAHHVNEGQVRLGKEKFRAFCEHMNRTYREELTDMVIFEAEGGTRGAAEFIVNGTYLETDEGFRRRGDRPTGCRPGRSFPCAMARSPGSRPITTSPTGSRRFRDPGHASDRRGGGGRA